VQVFTGVIRRRLNDLGCERAGIIRPVLPIVLVVPIAGALMALRGAPATDEVRFLSSFLYFAFGRCLLWQFHRIAHTIFQVMFAPSDAARRAPEASPACGGGFPAKQDEAAGESMQKAFERIHRVITARVRQASEAGRGPLAAGVRDAMEGIASARKAVKGAGGLRGTDAPRTVAKPKTDEQKPAAMSRRAVATVARLEPKTGRSRWYNGLFSGPWGVGDAVSHA
jgi:hypothetical protein